MVRRLLLLFVLGSAAAQAQHVALTRSAALTLHDVVEGAAGWQPEAAALAADRELARRQRDYAGGFIAEAPSLGMNYLSDGATDRVGLRQSEVYLKLPLWAPGERSANRAWAAARGEQTEVAQRQWRWQLSGLVRERVWQLALAQQQFEAEQERVHTLQQMLEPLQRQHAAGDVARYDTLLLEQELSDARQQLFSAEADLEDARRLYHALTNLSAVPAQIEETRSARTTLDNDHPQLALSAAQVKVAQEAQTVAMRENDSRPSLSLHVKREQAETGGPAIDSTGFSIEWPLGGGRNQVRAAGAAAVLTDAQVMQQRLYRDLQNQLHEVRHQLKVLSEQLTAAERSNALADEQWRMQQYAYRSGEISLQELLLTARRRFAARARLQQLKLERGRAVARYNQAVGELL